MNRNIRREVVANWWNIHQLYGVITATGWPIDQHLQGLRSILSRWYRIEIVKDDCVHDGTYDMTLPDVIWINDDASPAVISPVDFEDVTQPVVALEGENALDVLLMGNSAGGAGVSWGTAAAQTQIDILVDGHNMTWPLSIATYTVSNSASFNWIRTADLVAGAIPLATLQGDATKTVLAILPEGAANQAGAPAPGPRVFWGLYEFDLYRTDIIQDEFHIWNLIVEYLFTLARNTANNRIISLLSGVGRSGEQQVYPDLATGIQATDGGAAWTYGAAQTIVPAAGIAQPYRITGIHVQSFSNSVEIYEIQLRELSTGAVLVQDKFTAPFAQTLIDIVPSAVIAGGEGVDYRLATLVGGNDTMRIAIRYVEV